MNAPVPPDSHETVLRRATRADVPAIAALVEASVRALGAQHYTSSEVESSLRHLFGVDTRMIDDGTYLVAEAGGALVGAGGWSRRRTAFGGDAAVVLQGVRDDDRRDPATDPAVLRALFVHPDHARRGIGRRLLDASEAEAAREGFRMFELVATRSGHALYVAAGYRPAEPLEIALPDGERIAALRMTKSAPGA